MRAGGARAAVIGRRAGRGGGGDAAGGLSLQPGELLCSRGPGGAWPWVSLGRGVEGRLSGSAVPTWALCCVSVAGYRLTDLWAV